MPSGHLWRILPAILLAGWLGGCVSSQAEHRVPWNEADDAPYRREGTAAVLGEVSVKMRAGDISNGAEAFVYLIPVSPYSTEWLQQYVVKGGRIDGRDPRSFPASRATLVGPDGRFQFRNLPAGDYYLSCTVTRVLPPFRLGPIRLVSPSTERVEAYARVAVRDGEEWRVTVTRPDQS
jgi:hypothetical protein